MKNNLEADGPLIPPLHEDGTSFNYCMYTDGNMNVAFADDVEDLLNVLIPGYLAMSEADKDFSRIRLAQTVAAQVQAEIIFDVDPSLVSEEEWKALTAPRGVSQPRADWWTCEIPLVVVETGYEPYTNVPRPASAVADGRIDAENLWFLRPADEEDFLFSLHEVGYIRLLTNSVEDLA